MKRIRRAALQPKETAGLTKRWWLGASLASFLGGTLFATLVTWAWPDPTYSSRADELSPTRGFHSLVAGGYEGDRDGHFLRARFRNPSSLALDPHSGRLFVADQGNKKFKVIHLHEQNRVSSLGADKEFDLKGQKILSAQAALIDVASGELLLLDPQAGTLHRISLGADAYLAGTKDEMNSGPLAGGVDLDSSPDGVLVLSSQPPRLSLYRPAAPGPGAKPGDPKALSLVKTWTIEGIDPAKQALSLRLAEGRVLVIAAGGQYTAPYELRDEQGGYPGKSMNFAPTALPSRMIAKPLQFQNAGACGHFVKGSPQIELTSASSDFGQRLFVDEQSVRVQVMPIYDDEDRRIGDQSDLVWGKGTQVLTRDELEAGHRFLERPGAAVSDKETQTWYVIDSWGDRILAFKMFQGPDRSYQAGNSQGFNEWEYPGARRPHTLRMAVTGMSMIFYPGDTERRSHNFVKRLEVQSNLAGAQVGFPQGFEAIFVGAVYGFPPMGVSGLGQLYQRWGLIEQQYHPDLFVVPLSQSDLYVTAMDYATRPLGKEGVPQAAFDPEFAISPENGRLAGEYRDLVKLVKRREKDLRGLLSVNDQGMLSIHHDKSIDVAAQIMRDPELLEAFSPLVERYLKWLAGAMSKKQRAVVVYFPTAGALSREEGRSEGQVIDPEPWGLWLAKACAKHGLGFINVCDEFRLASVELPFFYYKNLHQNKRGQDLFARFTADRLIEWLEAQGAKP